MASSDKVTVEKAYFDALLRRRHTSIKPTSRSDLANVTISRVEYDSLLRTSREYELLKSALFQGGIAAETLELLISGADTAEQRKDSGTNGNSWDEDSKDQMTSYDRNQPDFEMPWRQNGSGPGFNLAPGSGAFDHEYSNGKLRVPSFHRQVSYGQAPSSVPDDAGFDDESYAEGGAQMHGDYQNAKQERRTLFFSGLTERTSYRDLLSIVKGGKVLSVNLRNERSATVTFLTGASQYLQWSRKNDIYLQSKRIEVKWADRQYTLNSHINNKILAGATRNIVIHGAVRQGLTEARIRDDMEHIHNLIIIDITYRAGDAYVSMNSIHNALFARTCMMSRTTYKGCKVEFFRDECDVPLPARAAAPKRVVSEPVKSNVGIVNRFNLLNVDDADGSSDEENRAPSEGDGSDDEGTVDMMPENVGVSLRFLDSESLA